MSTAYTRRGISRDAMRSLLIRRSWPTRTDARGIPHTDDIREALDLLRYLRSEINYVWWRRRPNRDMRMGRWYMLETVARLRLIFERVRDIPVRCLP